MKNNYEIYTPRIMSKMSQSEIHKEYRRLRAIANKRIARLEAAGLNRDNRKYATIQQIRESSKWNVESQLADVSKFLSTDRTTVRGTKKFLNDFQNIMTDKGYGDLVSSVEDIYNMIDFMEMMRERYSDKVFDSGDALDVLQEAQRLNIPKEKILENYELFATNLDKMENLKPSKNGAVFSQRRINNLIKKWI